jgi:hypothetical protein
MSPFSAAQIALTVNLALFSATSMMYCFIAHFDLEEDDPCYYLYGEVSGAKVEDITIEAHNDDTHLF